MESNLVLIPQRICFSDADLRGSASDYGGSVKQPYTGYSHGEIKTLFGFVLIQFLFLSPTGGQTFCFGG
jgi:hypothetical protein